MGQKAKPPRAGASAGLVMGARCSKQILSLQPRREACHALTLKLGSRFTLGAVDGLRVSELAERAGVAPSTVRFYERAGLLSPARRAADGYRVFDESALDELAFISRAKGIGMSLEDIAGLVASWPAGECRSL